MREASNPLPTDAGRPAGRPSVWRMAGALEAHALRHHRFSEPRRPPGRFTIQVCPGLRSGAPGWTRTSDRPVMSRRLWPLSYKRAMIGQGGRLRSCDLSVPSRGLYHAELHPVALRTGIKPASTRRQRVRLIRCVTEQIWCAGSDLNRHDFSAASQTAASAISPPAHLVDPAGIEPASTRIKSPPLNRSATGL
jgi:hypothetical protein